MIVRVDSGQDSQAHRRVEVEHGSAVADDRIAVGLRDLGSGERSTPVPPQRAASGRFRAVGLAAVTARFSLGRFSWWGSFLGNGVKKIHAFFFLDSHQCFEGCLVLVLRRQPILAGSTKVFHNLCRREIFLVVQ